MQLKEYHLDSSNHLTRTFDRILSIAPDSFYVSGGSVLRAYMGGVFKESDLYWREYDIWDIDLYSTSEEDIRVEVDRLHWISARKTVLPFTVSLGLEQVCHSSPQFVSTDNCYLLKGSPIIEAYFKGVSDFSQYDTRSDGRRETTSMIQIIKKDTSIGPMENTLETFDISVVKIAYKDGKFFMSPDTKKDIDERKFDFNIDSNSDEEEKNATLLRVAKYILRGFDLRDQSKYKEVFTASVCKSLPYSRLTNNTTY